MLDTVVRLLSRGKSVICHRKALLTRRKGQEGPTSIVNISVLKGGIVTWKLSVYKTYKGHNCLIS